LEEAAKGFALRTAALRAKGRVDRVWSRAAFAVEFSDLVSTSTGLSESDWDILLRFLERDKGVLVYDKDTVKLRADGDTSAITQEDATIASLKTLIKDLEVQVKVLETRVEELTVTAKQAVEKKNRISALAALRSKKLAETTLGKRHATLAQLEEVFVKIEQSNDQVELVRIMKASTAVLAGLNKQGGGVERVDNVVDSLREQMGQVDEVGNVLAEQGREGVDEGEVDEELEEMERVEREKREEVERKEREERERREVEEMRKRLDALEEVERQAREKETAEKEAAEKEKERQQDSAEQGLEENTEGVKRMSLDPTTG
jgi:charged multivesicular body protein 7